MLNNTYHDISFPTNKKTKGEKCKSTLLCSYSKISIFAQGRKQDMSSHVFPETDAYVSLSLLDGGSMTASMHKVHAGAKETPFRMYDWVFYIHNKKQKRRALWDLGFSSVSLFFFILRSISPFSLVSDFDFDRYVHRKRVTVGQEPLHALRPEVGLAGSPVPWSAGLFGRSNAATWVGICRYDRYSHFQVGDHNLEK